MPDVWHQRSTLREPRPRSSYKQKLLADPCWIRVLGSVSRAENFRDVTDQGIRSEQGRFSMVLHQSTGRVHEHFLYSQMKVSNGQQRVKESLTVNSRIHHLSCRGTKRLAPNHHLY